MINQSIAPVTVRQLNLYVKSLLEGDVRLSNCCVSGEITNFKNHYASGHLYFTLSDGDASVRCVMFRGNAVRLKLPLKDGMKIIANGRVSLYERDGGYQLYVESVNEDGVGDKLLALKLLKERLAAEGLFAPENKRAIPKMPKTVAVITSGTGAALQDILNILTRRYPLCRVVLCSAQVQGEAAAGELIRALDRVYDLADEIDTVIIGRGGGSKEDLDAFNDEGLARKIYDSPIPVISAVGHETDVTVCDMVADLRAPTPSAAAELATPNITELYSKINDLKASCGTVLKRKAELAGTRLNALLSRPCFAYPTRVIDTKAQGVDALNDRISAAVQANIRKEALRFSGIASKIEALSPIKTMLRGFAFAEFSGKALVSTAQVQKGDRISLRLSDGRIDCTVTEKEN